MRCQQYRADHKEAQSDEESKGDFGIQNRNNANNFNQFSDKVFQNPSEMFENFDFDKLDTIGSKTLETEGRVSGNLNSTTVEFDEAELSFETYPVKYILEPEIPNNIKAEKFVKKGEIFSPADEKEYHKL